MERFWKTGFGIGAAFIVICVVVGLLVGSDITKSDASDTHPSNATVVQKDAGKCKDTWFIVQADNDKNRWFAAGVESINTAATPEQAREAAHDWLNRVKRDPELLSGASAFFLHRQVDPATLVAGECATPAAEQLVAEIELTVASSKVTPAQAPADGINSGTNNGTVVAASNPGIGGDRKAILIELPDGTKIWIMARCGNPVVLGSAPVPPGPTDNPKPPTPPPTPPSTRKPALSWDCQQNGTGPNCPEGVKRVRQDPQDNSTSGVNTGPTPNAPAEAPPLPDPRPVDNRTNSSPAPDPTPNGSDSGSPTGSGTPSGSTTDDGGTSVGDNNTSPPVDTHQGGDNSGDGSTITNPW